MKYVFFLAAIVISFSAHAQYTSVDAFPGMQPFSGPIDVTSAGDGTNRLFVAQQRGLIYVMNNTPATTTRKVFLDLTDVVSKSGGELGLLGIDFHPDYENNGFFYVNYTTSVGFPRSTSVIARFQVSSTNPDSAVRSSEVRLFTVWQPYDNHNGGCMKFGPDGYLYISLGDGGSGGDPQNRAQNLDSLLGKILRIDVNDTTGGKKFGIPPSNPFASSSNNNRKMIFAYGLRNVWRMSFDALTGKLWGGDVGQGKWEEIDIIESGKNYGWKVLEGTHCFSPSSGCDTTGKVMPVYEYEHMNGNVSITGGYVYRGEKLKGLYGRYIYADYATGNTWSFLESDPYGTNTLLQAPTQTISSFGIDEAGELYACRYTGKRIYKFVPLNPLTSPNLTAPKNDSINTPEIVTLSWEAVNAAQSYQVTLAEDAAFTQGVIDTSSTTNSIELSFSQGKKYYWKVKASNNITVSDWSEVWTFTVEMLVGKPTSSPVQIYPINDTNVSLGSLPQTSYYHWHSVLTASHYELQVSRDSMLSVLYDSTNTADTFYESKQWDAGPYWWRVRACNESGCSQWSSNAHFTVTAYSIYDNFDKNSTVTLYPNPTSGSFTISSESEYIKDVRIYDVEGKPLDFSPAMTKFLTDKIKVTLTKPVSGTYFVEVVLEGGAKVVKKIVVE